MGIFDLLKEYFPAYRHEKLGPNTLPSDVLDDLRNSGACNLPKSDDLCEHDQSIDDIHERNDLNDLHQHQHFFHQTEGFENAFREMDSMFKVFFGNDPAFNVFRGEADVDIPDFHVFVEGTDNCECDGREKTLRDKMLAEDESSSRSHTLFPSHPSDGNQSHSVILTFPKPTFRDFWHSPLTEQEEMDDKIPVKTEDQDLDGKLENGTETLQSLFHNHTDAMSDYQQGNRDGLSIFGFGNQYPSDGCSSSVFKYSSTTKKVNPDGSVETTARRKDSDGNEEVVVSRSIGEQTYSVTSKKNRDGEEEKVENFINMDQCELEEFEGKWKGKDRQGVRDRVISPNETYSTSMVSLSDILSSWWKSM